MGSSNMIRRSSK